MTHFNWIDIVALLLLIRLGSMGIRLGIGAELTKLGGVLVGLLLGFRWAQGREGWTGVLMWAVLLIAGYLVTVLLLRLIQQAVTLQVTPALDKTGGGALGAARALLVMSVLLVMMQQLPSEFLQQSIQERSWSGRYLAQMAPAIYEAAAGRMIPHDS